jgi:hypothetical protein
MDGTDPSRLATQKDAINPSPLVAPRRWISDFGGYHQDRDMRFHIADAKLTRRGYHQDTDACTRVADETLSLSTGTCTSQ